MKLPENTSYSDLTAYLTAASSPWEVDSFPYLQGLDGNGTGNPPLRFCSIFKSVKVPTLDCINVKILLQQNLDNVIYSTALSKFCSNEQFSLGRILMVLTSAGSPADNHS